LKTIKTGHTIKKLMIVGVSIGIVVILTVTLLITSEFNSTVNESDNTDFAIILGAGLNGDQVSDRLKLRLDTAFDFLKNSDMPSLCLADKDLMS